ncbi:CAP domain-containing protein [Georgenia sunbinii]|uniref:CAP domain-containing protein n=1 Tax=Georgenia sunbinii TaxID=3117728 RepID=UPI002F26218C
MAVTTLVIVAAPAAGKGGEVDGRGDQYHLTNNWVASTDLGFAYGRDRDVVYVGDWNGDRVDTLAVRRGATYHLSNRLTGGGADRVLTYGRASDVVLMGDWDGDGIDTPAVRRGATYHLTNSLRGGEADRVLTYGRSRDVVLVGDWNGDGRDTLGVRRGSTYHLMNSLRGGEADAVVEYGRARDEVIVGDWDGDGRDTLGVRRGSAFHIKNSVSGGSADRVMNYGRAQDGVLVGDWDGNRTDTIGLRNDRPARADAPAGLAAFDQRMVELINVERSRAGVPAARAWAPLRDGALRHSSWMARTGSFVHAADPIIAADGVAAGCDASAENIFWGTGNYADDPEAVVAAYMNSPGHRASILARENRFVATGTVEADNGRIYNTQRFARSCS